MSLKNFGTSVAKQLNLKPPKPYKYHPDPKPAHVRMGRGTSTLRAVRAVRVLRLLRLLKAGRVEFRV